MGAFCCCPCGDDLEEYARPSNPIYRHCMCLRYFFHQLFSGYSTVFQRLDGRTATSAAQGVTPLTSTVLGTTAADNAMSEAYHLVPRPLPYDIDPRFSRSQRDGLVSRREKGMSHTLDGSQMLRKNGSSSGVEHLGAVTKQGTADSEDECKPKHAEPDKKLSAKGFGTGFTLTSAEDEDVCPTCLEEYTLDNPKIVTKCSHHFHLGCIYEWMERSENCPICGKEMDFCESP